MCSVHKWAGWEALRSVSKALDRASQSVVRAAQDERSGDSLVQEMRCRKGNIGTHSMRMPRVGKGEDADLGFCQDGSRTNKRGEAERDRCPW